MAKLAKRIMQDNNGFFKAGFDMGMQWAMDNVELELLRSGKLSRPQIRDLCRRTLERMQRNEHALNPKDVEADVAQYHIDEGLKEIWGEELCPWPERYENLKRCKYGGKYERFN